MNPTSAELTLFLLRIGVVAGLYLFCGWVALTIARDLRRAPDGGRLGRATSTQARPLTLVVAVSPEGPLRPGQRFPLDGIVTLGRDPENNIVLADSYVSARHAQFEWRNGRLWLEDLGSTNGTRINGRAIRTPMVVAPGDLIEVGNFGFRVVA